MRSFKNLPQKMPRDDREWSAFLIELAKLDIRNDRTDFADGLIADESGNALLGDNARLDDRTSTNVKTIVSRVGDNGRAKNQTLLNTLTILGLRSAQDAAPITAAADGATVTVTVAAHDVQIDIGTISYSAGTISGLEYDTVYYIYADDADLEGGAVAYYATTDITVVTASSDRYFVGSIWTPREAEVGTITAITKANPAVVTCANSFRNGDLVLISGVGGMTELNGNTYEIGSVSGTGFSLVGIDSTGYGTYTTGGTATLQSGTSTSSGGSGGGTTIPGAIE